MAISTYRRASTIREERSILLAALVAICYGVALQGSLAQDQTEWFNRLELPFWTAPSWLGGAVSTVIYGAMALSAWLVWTEREHLIEDKRYALGCFMAQLALYGLWPWVAYAWDFPLAGVVLLAVLCGASQYSGWVFLRIRPLAALLWFPYIVWTAWLLFQSALSLSQ